MCTILCCLWHLQRLKIINVTQASYSNPDSDLSTWFVSPSCPQTNVWCRQTELLLCLDLDLIGGAELSRISVATRLADLVPCGICSILFQTPPSMFDSAVNRNTGISAPSSPLDDLRLTSLPEDLVFPLFPSCLLICPRLSESKKWQHPASGITKQKFWEKVSSSHIDEHV